MPDPATEHLTPIDWFAAPSAAPTAVATLDRPTEWLTEFPMQDPDGDYSDSLSVTPHDVRVALGPQADELMASADLDVDELIRLINAETTVLPVIPDYLPDDFTADRSLAPAVEPQVLPEEQKKRSGIGEVVRTWKRTALRGVIAAILVSLIGGGAAAIAMNKSVTVEVDGQTTEVSTYSDTVGEVLDKAGVKTGQHDSLSPSLSAGVGDGSRIVVQKGRMVKLSVDGVQREGWVRARTVSDALQQLGMTPAPGAWVSEAGDKAVPLEGMSIAVKTLKNVTLYDGGNAPRQLSTTSVNIQELLTELGLTVGAQDAINPGADSRLGDGAEVRISRTGVTVINRAEQIAPPVRFVDDPALDKGKEIVEHEGAAGEKMVTYRITVKDGKETKREQLHEKETKAPLPRVIKKGTKKPPQPAVTDGAVWDRLAKCEAGGNWSINTGNGYYGGLQFDSRTWKANGGTQYAALPHQASREQQIAIATKVRDQRGGYSAWPGCSSKLGLSG
ncbi:uncharacterized protein YabE (DUF348 family) [Herbihabitans rhizosphaerae]|uniref:Uncharacterized protein YabE (DUF348 family) n=1 Tax=Herbihabitans rhizosphaerae TaxID=1872711 RepID=A0A4Q7KVY9_9PSEU|nr:resuscitation-promoting factor [Herbihabitans rhizosphaerae]RZS40817.1 uncharacterized protein YabE (DUF348 family) [Herbihabitans rhizosphaerae]